MTQARTQSQGASVQATATGDGVPLRDQLRDRDQLKDGSCDATEVVVASAAFHDDAAEAAGQLQERDTLVQRVVQGIPAGVTAWFRSMLRAFGLVD